MRKIVSLFHRQKLDAEMTDEMRSHLELQTERNIATGLNPNEARYLAQRQFGNVASVQEEARAARAWVWLEQSAQDLRYAARQLWKAPGFTAVAVITLAIGFGVNATMFQFVQNMFLRPVIQQKRGHLAALYTSEAKPGANYRDFSFAEYSTLRSSREIFSGIGAMSFDYGAVGRGDAVKRSFLCFVSDNYFQLLNVQPLAGRFFTAEETRPNAARAVVVANYALWQRLGARPDFVGSQIEINTHSFTVVGIAPAGFGGMHVSIGPDVWLPLGAMPVALVRADDLLDPKTFQLSLFGTLRPGLTLETARSRMGGLARVLDALAISGESRRLVLTAPPLFSVGNTAPVDESNLASFAALSLGLSASVLVVACLNLANMLLARGTARRKEIALRLSLGATRGRVVRQLLVESLLLAGIGSIFGLMVAEWTGVVITEFARAAFAEGIFTLTVHSNSVNVGVLLVTVFLAVASTLVFGLAPALRVTRSDLVDDLKQQGGQPASGASGNRFLSGRHCLVMAQISLSLMLLFSAGLFVRGARKAVDRDPGFRTEGELVFNVDYGFTGASGTPVSRKQEALLAQAIGTPGVARAALSSALPYNFESHWQKFATAGTIDGRESVSSATSACVTEVSRNYFQTLGIPLLRGRDFTAAENQPNHLPLVALIDDQLARALFGGDDAVGRHMVASGDDRNAIEIIGIVRSPYDDVWDQSPPCRVYRPLGQIRRPNTYLHVQLISPTAESAVLGELRRTLGAMDPEAPLLFAKPFSSFVQKNINLLLPRMAAIAFGAFGVISLLLAMVGVYGVKAYAVASRTKEIGIRLALGARPRDVMAMILRQGALQACAGVLVGTGLALVAGQALSKMLYQVSPIDSPSLVLAVVMVTFAALLACFIPARRATKVDPMVALRTE
jgi:predicted permease